MAVGAFYDLYVKHGSEKIPDAANCGRPNARVGVSK